MYVKKTWGAGVIALAALALLTGAADTSALTAPAAAAVPGEGSEEFARDGFFDVPANVTAFTVELWGAGGGGSAGGFGGDKGSATITWSGGGGGGAGGGGGGSGYYVKCRLTAVTPDTRFDIHTGPGGYFSGPENGLQDGDSIPTAGGDSWVTFAGRTLVLARGGHGAAGPPAKGTNAIYRQHGLGGKGKDGGYHGPGANCTSTAGINTERLDSRDGGSGTAGGDGTDGTDGRSSFLGLAGGPGRGGDGGKGGDGGAGFNGHGGGGAGERGKGGTGGRPLYGSPPNGTDGTDGTPGADAYVMRGADGHAVITW